MFENEKERPQVERAIQRQQAGPEPTPRMSDHPTVTERRKVREAPGPHFARVSAVWSAIVGTHIRPDQVVIMMAMLKLIRESGQHDPDNINDAIGYASLIDEVRYANEIPDIEF